MKRHIALYRFLILSLYCFISPSYHLFAQPIPSSPPTYISLRSIVFVTDSDTFCIDNVRFIPGSESLYLDSHLLQAGKHYNYFPKSGCLSFDSSLIGRELRLQARCFSPENLRYDYQHKDARRIEPGYKENPFIYKLESPTTLQTADIFKQSGLDVQGNISRGIGVGNRQDLILNSDMNLQISGKLSQDVEIIAAITDRNNPIQPEGNTQQIQDFDKVFIRIQSPRLTTTFGDFLMETTPGDYFKKYYKKSRGVQTQYTDSIAGGKLSFASELAVSRGRFTRNEIQGEEGNQGPYRLKGTSNQLFIVVISGTEAVYVDGKLMERGQQNDYVIDYNTGEITFMPKVLINRFTRIVVEFQFADQNYARTVAQVSNSFEKGRLRLRAGVFSEQDNRRQPIQQSLDFFDSTSNRSAEEVLSQAGDNPFLAVIPNVRKFSTFQTDRVMYRKIDSLGFSIYRFVENPLEDSVFYQVTFSRVGPGQGNYRQLVNLANGRVFEWVAPVAGVPAGDYEPLVQLAPPERLTLTTAGLDWKPDSATSISAELASSYNDINTFSDLDNQNNRGWGLQLKANRIDKKTTLNKRTVYMKHQVLGEWVDANFRYVERYRDVEFERSWTRQYQNPTAQRSFSEERILQYEGALGIEKKAEINYKWARYLRPGSFDGNQIGLGFKGEWKNLSIYQQYTGVLTEVVTPLTGGSPVLTQNQAADWKAGVRKTWNQKTSLSVDFHQEESKFVADTSENLQLISFKFSQYGIGFHHAYSEHGSLKLSYQKREDFLPVSTRLESKVLSDNITTGLEKEGKRWKDRLLFTLSYRGVQYADSQTRAELPEQTVLGRLEYQVSFLKRTITSNTFFQLGTGQEQRREFTYVEVRQGQGTHVWNDYNENGLQEINEFEPSVFADRANFIKVLVPTNQFIRSNTNEFNQTLRLTPPNTWNRAKGAKKILRRFSAIGSYRADRKTTESDLIKIINPFDLSIADVSLLSLSSLSKTTLFFNRSNPRFGMEYNYQENKQKQFLIQGFDSRDITKHALNIRYNISEKWSLLSVIEQGRRALLSDFAPNRNFSFDFWEYFPELFWQPNKMFRLGGFYKQYNAQNSPNWGGEKAEWDEWGFEFRSFLKNMTTIDGKCSYILIQYDGQTFSPVSYDMLRGFQNGKNFQWQLLIGGRIENNIQVSVNYEGRSNESAQTVHVGRVEVRYLF